MQTLVPINPAQDDKGRLRVLVPLLGDAAVPYPARKEDLDWSGIQMRVYNKQSSVTAAAKLGIADIFKVSGDGFYQGCILDYTVGVARYKTALQPNTVWGTLWGATVRVALRVQSLKASAHVDAGLVAANAELRLARVEYAVTAIGIGRKEFAAMLRGVPPFGSFDYSAFARLDASFRGLCQSLLPSLTRDQAKPIAVLLPDDPMQDTSLEEARADRWCAIQLAHANPLPKAQTTRPAWLTPQQVQDGYASFGVNGNDAIGEVVRAKAVRWLGGNQ